MELTRLILEFIGEPCECSIELSGFIINGIVLVIVKDIEPNLPPRII